MTLDDMLQQIKERLLCLYGERFRGLVLYGSVARGDFGPDSDMDLLCLLDGPAEGELLRIVSAVYPLRLESDMGFHIIPVNEAEFQKAELGFYRIVGREGITV